MRGMGSERHLSPLMRSPCATNIVLWYDLHIWKYSLITIKYIQNWSTPGSIKRRLMQSSSRFPWHKRTSPRRAISSLLGTSKRIFSFTCGRLARPSSE